MILKAALIIFSLSFVFSTLINALFLRFSFNLGQRNLRKNEIRWSPTEKPAFGGISFYFVFLISIIFLAVVFHNPTLFRDVSFLGFLLAVSIGFLTGLFDDAYNTKPLIKLASQILAAAIIIFTGTYIQLTGNLAFDYIVTLIWIIGIMNAINLLDNMDAISTIVVIGILSDILLVIMMTGLVQTPYIYIIVAMIGGLLGFLLFNWHPSKLYMGDTGSMLLGVLVAFLGVKFLWNFPQIASSENCIGLQILLPVTVFILPLTDTTTVFFKRIAKRSSPFIGGKDHTTHHLSYLGLSDRNIAFIFAFIALVSAYIVSRLVMNFPVINNLVSVGAISFIFLIFSFLFTIAQFNKKK